MPEIDVGAEIIARRPRVSNSGPSSERPEEIAERERQQVEADVVLGGTP